MKTWTSDLPCPGFNRTRSTHDVSPCVVTCSGSAFLALEHGPSPCLASTLLAPRAHDVVHISIDMRAFFAPPTSLRVCVTRVRCACTHVRRRGWRLPRAQARTHAPVNTTRDSTRSRSGSIIDDDSLPGARRPARAHEDACKWDRISRARAHELACNFKHIEQGRSQRAHMTLRM